MTVRQFWRGSCAGVLLVCVGGCVAPLRVHPVEPPPPAGVDPAQIGEIRRAASLPPAPAAAALMAALATTESRIAAGDTTLIPVYNDQVARLMESLSAAGTGPWDTTSVVTGSAGTYHVAWRDPGRAWIPDRELVATDSLRFTGPYAGPPARREGVGATLVIEAPTPVDLEHFDPEKDRLTERYRSVTAMVQVRGNSAEITLLDPFETDAVRFGGRNLPLAADFSTAASLSVARDRIDRLGFARMINPSRYSATTTLAPAQPYDPERIPVLLVHGLQDTPATWLPLYRELMRDPVIRKHYQFWVYSYPSGYPYPYSASLLRKDLDRVRSKHPDHKDLVLVGHSMGGVISRLVLLDPGDGIWRHYFGTPPAETPIKGGSRKLLEEALIFEPRPDVARAVFFSAPHRGSEIADNWIGRLGSRLVRTPSLFADLRDATLNVLARDEAALHLDRAPNSIDTLAPDDRFVLATKDLPIAGGVPYHSVMGNRGKDGPREKSSDGVVAYWSSHVDGARSERLVPSGHSSHRNPEGIEEMRRILHLHLRK